MTKSSRLPSIWEPGIQETIIISVVAHAYNHSIWEAVTGLVQIQSQTELYGKTMSKKEVSRKKINQIL